MAVQVYAGTYSVGYPLGAPTEPFIPHNEPAHAPVFGELDSPEGPIGENSAHTNNQPTSPLRVPHPVAGRNPTFFDDYYNRIHINPSRFELGNLLSSQTREAFVWNAYTEAKLLSGIDESGAGGIDLSGPIDTPTVFNAYEERTYSINISTNGPPVVNAVFTFNFDGESPTLTISGRRVVIWSFVPEANHTETLEWKTDIIDAYAEEQRIALRPAPRQSFSYTFELDPEQFSRAKPVATQWAHRVYGIPVWSDVVKVGPLSQGITFIAFNTAHADHRNDGLVIVWDDDLNSIAAEVTTVEPGGVNLAIPLSRGFSNAYVAPIRFAKTLGGMQFTRSHNERIVARATYLVDDNVDLGDELDYPVYRGRPVLTDRTVVVQDINERIARAVDVFDNGSGVIEVDTQKDWVRFGQMIAFTHTDRQSRWDRRRWLHARRGRQRSFWLPSWNPDINLTTEIGLASTSMEITSIGYSLYYDIKDFMIQMKSGVRHFNRATGAAAGDNGLEVVTLESGFGVPIPPEDVDFICFLSHVRLDADTVAISHSEAGRVDISVPVTEVPE